MRGLRRLALRGAPGLALALALAACAPSRTPCDQTLGADVCSMVPREMTCECRGHVEPARAEDQPIACGRVRTMCVGDPKPVVHEGTAFPLPFTRADGGAPR